MTSFIYFKFGVHNDRMLMKTPYLAYAFADTPEFVNTFDELPLWSASFGLLLLKHVELKHNLTVLDIGSGAGFPLLELAQRLGDSCKCIGIDPWTNANERAKQKVHNYDLHNVSIVNCSATELPFDEGYADLIVSNLGINNFEDPHKVFSECCRVLKPGGKLALTTNLNGHWQQFYDVFESTLHEIGRPELIVKLKDDQDHRGTVETISGLFANNGFKVSRHFEESFEMRFLDGTAFLNHYFVKLGWLLSWKNFIPEKDQAAIFAKLEENLNAYAAVNSGLSLTVPMAFIEGQKI